MKWRRKFDDATDLCCHKSGEEVLALHPDVEQVHSEADRGGDTREEQWSCPVEDVDLGLELAGVVQHVAIGLERVAAGQQQA